MPEDVIGRNCRFLQGGKREQQGVQEIRAAIAEKRACVVEPLNFRKDGTRFINGCL